jgi:hypothetical protein
MLSLPQNKVMQPRFQTYQSSLYSKLRKVRHITKGNNVNRKLSRVEM